MLKKILLPLIFGLSMAFLYLNFGYEGTEATKTPIAPPPITKTLPKGPLKQEKISTFQKERLIETYLDSSGLWAQLGLPEKILNKHLANPKMLKKLSMEDLEKIKQLIQEKLGVDAISKKVKDQILDTFSPEELKDLIEIFSSPIMKKVASLEEYLSSEDLLVKASLIQLPTDKNSYRAKLLKKLEEIKGDGERSFLITLHSIKGLHQGFNKILPRKKRVPESKVKSTLSILKKYARPKFKNLALIRYDYAYKELSNSELKQYISIARNNLMQKVQKATLRGILDSFEDL
ncbi:MAG: hypothetical protein DRQ88_13065 [Epsilonproteobacteria bacterium]|nr:MAG: hypothetical protein DRQ88_13065 [Campylobacterota bacterium]RLA62948.1 MAG: hypothetical protein DRQ89_08220 [Campylobacterota bacterium]